MSDLDQLLAEAFSDLGRRAPHDPDLAGSVRRRARRQGAIAASAAGVLAVVGVSTAVATGRPGTDPAPMAPAGGMAASTPPRVAGCQVPERGVLPEWARYGFSDPNPRAVFVRGAKGNILAVLFAQPLVAPAPPKGRNNKILWVARVAGPGSETLVIDARQDGTGLRVRREVPGGPGPSTVDLPAAGCWQLDLRWGPYTDSLALRYVPR